MRKIFLLLLCVMTVLVAVGCGADSEEEKEELQVAGRENDFFNLDVSIQNVNYSWGVGKSFVVKVSPKTSKYRFNAANDMEVTIRYSANDKNTGEFESNNTWTIDVKYDKNGYGYEEESLNATRFENIIILSYEASVSAWETATSRMTESDGTKITINQSNILQYLKFDHDITGLNKIDFYSTIYPTQHYWYEIDEIYVLTTIEFDIKYRCNSYLDTCEAYNSTSFSLTFSFCKTGGLDSSIDGGVDRYTLPGICDHGINKKTLEVNFRIISAEGYYIV